jgi:hypothetical protein
MCQSTPYPFEAKETYHRGKRDLLETPYPSTPYPLSLSP